MTYPIHEATDQVSSPTRTEDEADEDLTEGQADMALEMMTVAISIRDEF